MLRQSVQCKDMCAEKGEIAWTYVQVVISLFAGPSSFDQDAAPSLVLHSLLVHALWAQDESDEVDVGIVSLWNVHLLLVLSTIIIVSSHAVVASWWRHSTVTTGATGRGSTTIA